jgi:diguanylate cyclase (GGDEF)-like protein
MDKQHPPLTIGLMTPHLGGVFNGSIIANTYQHLRRRGVRLIVVQESPEAVGRLRLAQELVHGWLVLSNVAGVAQLAATGVPVVTISSLVPGVPAVLPDNHSVTRATVEHLIGHGHRRIAYIGHLANLDMAQRFASYRDTLAAHDIPFDARLLVDLEDEWESGGSAGVRVLLASGQPFSAIVAGNDLTALGALAALREAGLRVPDDVAVVGFDDIDLSRAATPPLTTAHQSYKVLATLAADRLLAQLVDPGRPADITYAPTALVIRRSCGCPRSHGLLLGDPDAIVAAPDRATALMQQLIQIISYPFSPDSSYTPVQLWPGLTTLVAAVERAAGGGELPAEAALSQAWSEAIALTANPDPLNAAANLLEEVATRLNRQSVVSLNRALQQIRSELVRTLMAHEAEEARQLDAILYANNAVSTTMLNHSGNSAPELTWLRHIQAPWGALGLWDDPAQPAELVLVSVYAGAGPDVPALSERVAPPAFPPLTATTLEPPADIITLVPLRSARRDWGILAIAGLVDTSVTWNNDPFAMWARMLSAALERAALLKDLAVQQQGLLEVYQREQVLTATLRRNEEQLRHNATHDALTGLPNRSLLLERLRGALQRARQAPERLFALLFLDLDRFKTINDSLGHPIGDGLLVGIAQRLRALVRASDTVARLGGDEFVILLDGMASSDDATLIAQRIQESLREPFSLNGHELVASTSIGILVGLDGHEQPEELLRDADIAMYRAKALGGARHETFAEPLHQAALARLQLETDLRRALERQEFTLHYQPIVALDRRQIIGAEALVRWQHPSRGMVAPLDFIPLAEETGLIEPLGRWVLRRACAQMRAWHHLGFEQLTIAVNISVSELKVPGFAEMVAETLGETGLPGESLILEFTESVYMGEAAATSEVVQRLREMGVQIAFDDFGTGYSSLNYLRRFQASWIKIDRSFVQDLAPEANGPAIVGALIAMAHQLNITVVAEGVETEEQLGMLRSHQCDTIQGYLISQPVPDDAFYDLLSRPVFDAIISA